MQIYCYNKRGVILKEFNPYLPFGDHLLGFLKKNLSRTRAFSTFAVVCTIDEGV
jgi:hypothetical protein